MFEISVLNSKAKSARRVSMLSLHAWNQYRSGQTKSIRITAKINPFPFVAKLLVFAAVSVAFGVLTN